MSTHSNHNIQIFRGESSQLAHSLLSILEFLFPIQFIADSSSNKLFSGTIIDHQKLPDIGVVGTKTAPTLSLFSIDGATQKNSPIEVEVDFEDIPEVPWPFCGRRVTTCVTSPKSFLDLKQGEKVLASIGSLPVWTVSCRDGQRHFRSSLPLSKISAGDGISTVFSGSNFLELLPVIHFIRELCQTSEYRAPQLRASYIVDDPNLHRIRYGYVDYEKMAAHAQENSYHVGFATIPLDTWFTDVRAARIFKRNTQWLSLLIHGNNHSKNELARIYTPAARGGLLKQAIRRIERLEAKTSINVCRVMVPPHGACAEEMLAALPEQGFEAACISAGSLRTHNRDRSWTRTVGYWPSETIAGCPVLPRSGLTGYVESGLLLAAYLGQPLILRGHHVDFKDGLDVLGKYSKFINGLGDVAWSNMTEISRMNYASRIDGEVYRVRPYSNRLTVKLPTDARVLIVEGPPDIDHYQWQLTTSDGTQVSQVQNQFRTLPTTDDNQFILTRTEAVNVHAIEVSSKRTSVALIGRRLATEARDRFLD